VVTLLPGYIATPLTARNPYPMPFLMTPRTFADAAFAAIGPGASYRVIPWQMGVVAKLLRLLPNPLFDRLFAGRGRKPRRRRRADQAAPCSAWPERQRPREGAFVYSAPGDQ
jgi:short-subunit dehydrogenase